MKSNKQQRQTVLGIYAAMQIPMNSFQNVEVRKALIRYYTKKGYLAFTNDEELYCDGMLNATYEKPQPTRKLLKTLQKLQFVIPQFYEQQKLYDESKGLVVKYKNIYGEERYD